MKPLRTIILAAGEGKRMNSSLPKVLHSLHGTPLIRWVWDTALQVGSERIVIVVGHGRSQVMQEMSSTDAWFAVQWNQLGTGDAVQSAKRSIHHRYTGDVLVLSGDVPLLSSKTVSNLRYAHERNGAVASVLTFRTENPGSYGRIVRDGNQLIKKIVEFKDATVEETTINEVNSGVYIFQAKWLWKELAKLRPENAQGEYYLTDVVKHAVDSGERVTTVETHDAIEVEGVNTVEQLHELEKVLTERMQRNNR